MTHNTYSKNDIFNLLMSNSVNKFGPRNAALIIAASYWGLDKKEICQLNVSNIMTPEGEWLDTWVLPASISFTGIPRTLYTGRHVINILDEYVEWKKKRFLGTGDDSLYRGISSATPLFVNDRYSPFALTARRKRKDDGEFSYQTRALDEKLTTFIHNAGIDGTASALRDSWINMLYQSGCHIDDIQLVSGIKTREAIKSKVTPLNQISNAIALPVVFERILN